MTRDEQGNDSGINDFDYLISQFSLQINLMGLSINDIKRIEACLSSDSSPRWMTAQGIMKKLNLIESNPSIIDKSLDQYTSETGCNIRKSILPSRSGSLEVLWGHVSKVNNREVSSIFRKDNPIVNRYPRPSGEKLPDLFFSHSFRDTEIVIELAKQLENYDIHSWLAEMDILHGGQINQAVYSAIQSCNLFGVYLSEHSVSSTWTAKEIEIGLNGSKPVLGFLDISNRESLRKFENALYRNSHEVRSYIFSQFFSPGSDVVFFGKNGERSQQISIYGIDIDIRDWNYLNELIRDNR